MPEKILRHSEALGGISRTAFRTDVAESSQVIEIQGEGNCERRPCAKAIYSSSLSTADRLQMHDVIVKQLDAAGNESSDLESAITEIFAAMKDRGLLAEAINVA